MKISRTVAIIILVVVSVLGIPLLYLFSKTPAVMLTPAEKELLTFNAQQVIVSQGKTKTEYSTLESPIKPMIKSDTKTTDTGKKPDASSVATVTASPVAKKTDNRVQSLRQPISQAGLPSVSMVYSDGSNMMAIVDGHVVKEGTTIGAVKIVTIEQKRVLMTVHGKNTWIDVN